jgi:DNA-binding transcriptional LysR family regulator
MDERNVTREAERLAMSQPAVSNALRRLREAIGEELFVPSPTGVTPTAQAEALWPAVRESLSGHHSLAVRNAARRGRAALAPPP